MKILKSKYFRAIIILSALYGCMVTSHSAYYQKIIDGKDKSANIGQEKFLYGDMGGIYPKTLKTNGFIYKMAVLALYKTEYDRSNAKVKPFDDRSLFKKYGFIYPEKIWNWDQHNIDAKFDKPAGILTGSISGIHPTKGRYFLETANLGCATCHGGILYDKNGEPTNQFVLGMPSSSINLKAFANDIYEGYKKIIRLKESAFDKEITELFPEIKKEELNGLNIFLRSLKKEIKKIQSTCDCPTSYKIGGAGTMNGIGAIKRTLGLMDNYFYDPHEAASVSIPGISNINFRSSLLISGNYAPKGQIFFKAMTLTDMSEIHERDLAKIISLFTIGTMGYDDKMAEKAIPDVEDVVSYLAKFEPPTFPGNIDSIKVKNGRNIYNNYCQSCHGKYEGSFPNNKLVRFPNQLTSLNEIGTDTLRAVRITMKNIKYLDKTTMGKYVDAKLNKGYVAPILDGLWATAPYLHNGSIPTLWHLMHPGSRPDKFYVGGHQLDYDKIGIKGEINDGIYKYAGNYKSWCSYEIFDTTQPGQLNTGHNEPFDKLSEKEKNDLLEFLKTL